MPSPAPVSVPDPAPPPAPVQAAPAAPHSTDQSAPTPGVGALLGPEISALSKKFYGLPLWAYLVLILSAIFFMIGVYLIVKALRKR